MVRKASNSLSRTRYASITAQVYSPVSSPFSSMALALTRASETDLTLFSTLSDLGGALLIRLMNEFSGNIRYTAYRMPIITAIIKIVSSILRKSTGPPFWDDPGVKEKVSVAELVFVWIEGELRSGEV